MSSSLQPSSSLRTQIEGEGGRLDVERQQRREKEKDATQGKSTDVVMFYEKRPTGYVAGDEMV